MTNPPRKRLTPDWQLRAACKDADPALFSPHPTAQRTIGIGRAHQFCDTCPVLFDCAWAGLNGFDDVTMGGMTFYERERIKAKTPAALYASPELTEHLLTVIAPECEDCGKHQRSVKHGVCYPCQFVRKRIVAEQLEAKRLLRIHEEKVKKNAEDRRPAREDEQADGCTATA